MQTSRPITIAAYLEQKPESGGAFHQGLNDLDWLSSNIDANYTSLMVFTNQAQNLDILVSKGYKPQLLKESLVDYIIFGLKLTTLFQFAQKSLKWTSPFENKLKSRGIDFVYFLSPSKLFSLLDSTPFAVTVFDDCHRDMPEFPEVSSYGEFERREWFSRLSFVKASLIIANSALLQNRLVFRYGVDESRIIQLPFLPSPFLNSDAQNAGGVEGFGIEPGYIFYPAQFWPHKNHTTLLVALARLKKRGINAQLVLCGSEKSNEGMIRRQVEDLGLTNSVKLLGFVPSESLTHLYSNAGMLVMPTYFGPTNLPILEAWRSKLPVIYPRQFAGEVGSAAILFDYDDPESLAEAIAGVLDISDRDKLVEAGEENLARISMRRKDSGNELRHFLNRLANRLATFNSFNS